MNEKMVKKLGWFASSLTILMFFSYIDQIKLNISGHPGSIILPIITALNCIAWGVYATVKEKKDWPLILCNIPGFTFSAITAVTAIIYS